ncbi:MAG: M56 family metallopeptidase [Lachnospiraceae bacterium]|nr:M56 family metallopeptidase [Lachnospiraceae bacterium]
MDWVNNLFLALLLTDITGTIFFLAELLLRKWTRLDAGFMRFMTMVSLSAYLVPLVYFVLYAHRWFSTAVTADKVNLFYNTPLIRILNAIGGFVWIGLFLIFLAIRMVRCMRWKWICRGNIPEEDEVVFKVFRDVCAELGIKGRMSVCMNDSVAMPCITYDHGYTVVMPLLRYTEEEARVIFYHELCHFRNGDLIIKTIGSIVTLLHAFNPAAHFLFRQMKVDCEKYCDRVACEKGANMFTDSGYFQVILNLSSEDGNRNRYQLFTLADGRQDCERRVKYMGEYQKRGNLKRATAIALGACFLLGSSMTSLAAGSGVLNLYEGIADWSSIKNTYEKSATDSTMDSMTDISPESMVDSMLDITPENIIDSTVENTIEGVADDADEEIRQILSRMYDLDPADVIMMGDDGIELQGLFYNVSWNIPARKTYVSTGFKHKVGDYIYLSVVGDPEDIEYEMGIKDPEDIMWYVEGSGTTSQRFDIVLDGRHYFYMMNLSKDEELHADIGLIRHIADEEEKEAE